MTIIHNAIAKLLRPIVSELVREQADKITSSAAAQAVEKVTDLANRGGQFARAIGRCGLVGEAGPEIVMPRKLDGKPSQKKCQ